MTAIDFFVWEGNAEEESIVEVEMIDKDGTNRALEFLSEGKVDFAGIGATWSITGTGDVLTIKSDVENGAEWVVEKNDDGSYSITYDYHNVEGTVFSGVLSAEDLSVLSASQAIAQVTLYFGGNTESSVTTPVTFGHGGVLTHIGSEGELNTTWKVENGTLVFGDEIFTYDADTGTLRKAAGGDMFFSAVLTEEQQEALGIVA